MKMSRCIVCTRHFFLRAKPPPPMDHRIFVETRELLEADSGGKGGGGGGGRGFDVSKAGDTRVGFVGFPSVGKSTLLTKLTGTHSEAAAYEVRHTEQACVLTSVGCCSFFERRGGFRQGSPSCTRRNSFGRGEPQLWDGLFGLIPVEICYFFACCYWCGNLNLRGTEIFERQAQSAVARPGDAVSPDLTAVPLP